MPRNVTSAWMPSTGIASMATPATTEIAPQTSATQKPRHVQVPAAMPSCAMPAAISVPAQR